MLAAGARPVLATVRGFATGARPTLARPYDLAKDLNPTVVNGTFRKPRISARVAAKIRKDAILSGNYGPVNAQAASGLEAGAAPVLRWDPAWDKVRVTSVLRTPKGHARANELQERLDKVTKALQGMPAKIADFRKAETARRPLKGFAAILKKSASRAKGATETKK